MNKDIKAVFFDATDTLIQLQGGVGYHYRLVAEQHGILLEEAALNRAFRDTWKKMPARPMTAMQRPDDDKGWWRDLAREVVALSGGNVEAGRFDAYFEDLYLHFTKPGVWQLFPDVKPALARLAGKCRIGVISNFDQRLRVILDHLEIGGCFDGIFISSEVGADKPDPHIFQHALNTFGVKPGEALHVGDDPRNDWDAAGAAGMQVFRLERPANSLADLTFSNF